MTGSIPLIATAVTAALLAGLLLAFLRGIKARLAEHLGVTQERLGRRAPAYALALVLMMLVTGLLIDKWGVQAVLVTSSLLAAVGIATIEAVTVSKASWPGFTLLAAGAGGCATSAAVLAPKAFFADNEVGAANLAALAFTVGVLLTPPLTAGLIARLGFRRGLLMIALACLLPGTLALLPGSAEFGARAQLDSVEDVARRPAVWMAALVLFCYRPVQEGFGNWSRRYLGEVGYTPEDATGVFAMFWLTFLATRLVCAFIVLPGFEAWWILGASLMAGVVIGNMIGTFSSGGGKAGLFLLAICMAPILPAALGVVLRLYPHAQGTATGMFLAAGVGAAQLVPSLIHPADKRHSVRAAMGLSLVFALLVAAPAIVLAVLPSWR